MENKAGLLENKAGLLENKAGLLENKAGLLKNTPRVIFITPKVILVTPKEKLMVRGKLKYKDILKHGREMEEEIVSLTKKGKKIKEWLLQHNGLEPIT